METEASLALQRPLLIVASESDLIFPIVSVCFFPRSWDPMVEEAALGIIIASPSIVMSPCLNKLLPHVDI
jgi:hypothetical protein